MTINVSGTLRIENGGSINSNGGNGTLGGGGGAGGEIQIGAYEISGDGSFSAKGGDGAYGGGGTIDLLANIWDWTGTHSVAGGAGAGSGHNGQSGIFKAYHYSFNGGNITPIYYVNEAHL